MSKSDEIQVFGSGQEALSMIFEIVSTYNPPPFISVIPNIDPFIEDLSMPFQNPSIRYKICKPDEYDWEGKEIRCVIGAMGSLRQSSKKDIVRWFLENYNIQKTSYVNVIHPNTTISATSTLQNGVHIEPGVILAPYTTLGFGVSINRNVSVGHHTRVGDFTTINPGANIASSCLIGENVIIGSHSFISDHIQVGDGSIIGAGSIVLNDIPPGVLAYGNPCRIIRTL